MITGDRKSCNANKISISTRPPMCHSREGGNPYSTSLRGELASLKDSYSAHAQWIPAFAGMTRWPTGWPRARARATRRIDRLALSTGMPVKAVSMRLPRHALPRGKLAAVPGNAKNVRWIKRGINMARGHPAWPYVTQKATRG